MKTIESRQNLNVKQWMKLKQKKHREKLGAFIVEGTHLVEEALKAGQVKQLLMVSDYEMPRQWQAWLEDDVETFVLSDDIFDTLANTETPQGIMAVCPMYQDKLNMMSNGRYLLLDAVRDPGNMGTLIRTADACGFNAVIVGADCVDFYNSKVLRSAQGSHFHIRLIESDISDTMTTLQDKKVPVMGTMMTGVDVFQLESDHRGGFALLLGNEGAGVSEAYLQQTDVNVQIPIFGRAESLNVSVAGGILMYTLRDRLA
ncbi:TrmH family RNA methyltransferase [Tuberibacillus sp. Marseille-P3662]|uniref:TrmH family RNA methyltransferase n=1 Tax=Tuberibacillus sp. Marseille-P3662 TaxID=1965358 RepID=UPI000A1CCABA|nr:RNA methyltransferase [Tuberibacillus sp. Marseille-P3662]